MKTYLMIGTNIGIEVKAENAVEAKEIAERKLLCGLGGEIAFCSESDQREYEAEAKGN